MNKYEIDLGRINEDGAEPKYIQISNRIRELIVGGELSLGSRLPSINHIIESFSVSRDTVVKAYQDLKNRGIVESSPCKAYFVRNIFIQENLKHVVFLADEMTPYKEKIYHGLVDCLPSGYFVDPICHGNRFDLLQVAYERYRDMTNVVAMLVIPTSSQNNDADYFQYVNPGKLLFVDRKIEGLRLPAVYQDFTEGFYKGLMDEREILAKYDRLTFLTRYCTDAIIEQMKEGLMRFSEMAGKAFRHLRTPFTEQEIRGKVEPCAGDLFVILDDLLLIETLSACKAHNLVPGKDVGIIAINDGPFFEHLPIPISVLTTDFYQMGIAAASFVTTGRINREVIPTRLIVRASI
jgi:DNA-binding transcriptional regulator YhcF (GntR family)